MASEGRKLDKKKISNDPRMCSETLGSTLSVVKKCSDEKIDFNLSNLLTHPSLQTLVERLLLLFLST